MKPHGEGPTGLTAAEMLSLEQEVVHSIPDIALRYAPDGVVTWASPSLFHCLGYRPEDVVGTRFRMVSDEDTVALVDDFQQALTRHLDRIGLRFDLRKADGTKVAAEAMLRFEYDDAGNHLSTLSILRILGQTGEPERLFPILSEHATDVIIILDNRGYLVWASASTTRVLGFDVASLIGEVRPLVPAEDLPGLYDWFASCIESRSTAANRRIRVLRIDGSWLWMDMSAVFVRNSEAELEYAVATLRDVHVQVLAEEALREAERTFSCLADYTTDIVYRSSTEGIINWISPSVTALLGWTPEEALGREAAQFVHPDDLSLIEMNAQRTVGGRFPTVEVRLRTSSGEYRWVELSRGLIFDEEGTTVGRVGGIRDLQEHRRARTELAASEQKFRAAMRDSAVAMCLVTPEGGITTANAAMCDFLGRSMEETIGTHWQEILRPAEVPEDEENVRLMRAGEQDSFSGVRHYARPDGTRVIGHVTVSALRDDEDVLTEFVVQILDITAREQERQLVADSEAHYRLLADSVTDVVVQCDDNGSVLWASRSLTAATGLWPSDAVGRPFIDMLHPNDIEAVQRTLGEVRRGRTCELEVRVGTAAGEFHWFALTVRPPFEDGSATPGCVATMRDIRNEIRVRALLAEREAEFREIAEHAADVVFRMDASDTITWISPSIGEVLGYAFRDVLGQDPKVFVHPEDLPGFYAFANGLLPNEPERVTLRAHCADGQYRWFSAIATKITDEQGTLVSQIVGLRNIDKEVQAVTALARSEEQFRLAMVSAPSGMAVVDLTGQFVQVNDTLAEITGRSRPWLQEHKLSEVVDPDDWPSVKRLHDRLTGGEVPAAVVECRLMHADGHTLWAQSSLAVLRDERGQPVSFVAQFVDISDARAAHEALRHAATHDPLTLLGNRRGLAESLDDLLTQQPRTGTRIGVLALDLDGLKPINDQFGHPAGDHVLVAASERLRKAVRSDDVLARVGGDEFIVVLRGIHTLEQMINIAEKIRSSLSQPVDLGHGANTRIKVSIGGVLVQAGHDADSVLKSADRALYDAKQTGGNRVVVRHPISAAPPPV